MANYGKNLEKFRSFMKKEELDLFVINTTDEYLNEYVSLEDNARYQLTGFSGSTGDAIVTPDEVFLFVDGRYHFQAEIETNPEFITVVKVGIDTSSIKALYEKLAELTDGKANIGIVSAKTSCAGYKELLKNLEGKENIKIVEYDHDPFMKMLSVVQKTHAHCDLRQIPVEITGMSSEEKLEQVNRFNRENGIDFLLVTDLSDIAYLTNLRGQEIPFSACFRARAAIFRGKAYVFADVSKEVRAEGFEFRQEAEFESFIKELGQTENVYYHPASTSLSVFRTVEKLSDQVIETKDSFISSMKAVKTPAEIEHMRECFVKSDTVVHRAICWLNQNLEKGEKISEKDFSDRVKELFSEEDALGLSFEPITASGKNSAFIHYMNPDPEKYIEMGEFVLLDCGAHYAGGYATDTTRTFLAGGSRAVAAKMQKQVYTAVLKAFLTGINFELGEDTSGFSLDEAVRKVIESCKPEGFSFSHATGHGIGICVHESPPGVGPSEASKKPLKEGMCFTVEPGLYNDEFGGVRIENTVCVVEKDGELRIKTLSHAGLDENLIDFEMLTDREKSLLMEYQKSKVG